MDKIYINDVALAHLRNLEESGDPSRPFDVLAAAFDDSGEAAAKLSQLGRVVCAGIRAQSEIYADPHALEEELAIWYDVMEEDDGND